MDETTNSYELAQSHELEGPPEPGLVCQLPDIVFLRVWEQCSSRERVSLFRSCKAVREQAIRNVPDITFQWQNTGKGRGLRIRG